jgi:hypothetical protein
MDGPFRSPTFVGVTVTSDQCAVDVAVTADQCVVGEKYFISDDVWLYESSALELVAMNYIEIIDISFLVFLII